MGNDDKYLDRTSLFIARILLLAFTPGLLASVHRAAVADGAWSIVAVQTALYLPLFLSAFASRIMNHQRRLATLAFIVTCIGLGAVVRNQDSLPFYFYWLLATLLLSQIIHGKAIYWVFMAGNLIALALSQLLDIGPLNKELSRFVGSAAAGISALYIVLEHAARVTKERAENRNLASELSRQLERQKELFAVVGHELRTPVATISMIGRDRETSSQHARDQIVEISDSLLSVLEDLRIVVAPERALESKARESCDPVRMIRRALSPLAQLMDKYSIKLNINISKPEGEAFLLHAQPLRQVVTNLVKNAAVHSAGSAVTVSFDYQMEPDGDLLGYLKVEDDGIGIPEHLRQQVFEPFGRGETTSDGSGLGLFIVKQISSLMGGTLEYATSQLGGACFTLTFPMKRAPAEDRQERVISLQGLKILLAEDDAMLRMLTEKSLSKLGAEITSYDNGQKALAAYQAQQFDIVLTDLMMPMMNGHDLTKALRAQGSKTPIIGVTAAVIGEETDHWLNDGASAFISKPITPEKLEQTLLSIGFALPEAT